VEGIQKPWWRNIYLLGFDAPLIGIVWLFLLAKTWRVNYHPWEAYVVLGLLVWSARIATKLLKSAMITDPHEPLHDMRKWLTRSAVYAVILSLLLIIIFFPMAIYTRLLILALFIIAYFALANFATETEGQISYPKHILAGLAFAFGISMMAHIYLPSMGLLELFRSREFICFGLLCTIASAAVEHWMRSKQNQKSRFPDEWQISLPLTLLGAAALVFAVQADSQAETQTTRPYFYCVLTAAALLQVLNRTFHRFECNDIKLLTSACFLVPGLIFQAYRMSL
jgi:hypothetical protein